MKPWMNYIRKVEPYVPGEQPNKEKMIKLNTNENPYPPSKKVLKRMQEIDISNLRLYPDPKASLLVEAIAEYQQLENDQIFIGVGSDDVLGMAFLTFFHSDQPILFPDITYSFYPVWANLFQIPYECPALDQNFHIVKEDYYKKNGGIVIANPNAPTSIYEDITFIEDLLLHNQESIVIVDEAYIDFAGISAKELIKKYDNLLVVQTFSKSRSMAGMRIGYAMGHKDLIKALQNVKYSYNSYTMNYFTLQLGECSIRDNEYFRCIVNKIIATRERIKVELKELGFSFPESSANFIFATHNKLSAKELFLELRKAEVYVRYFEQPRIDNYIRITIGTDEEMDQFIKQIKEILRNKLKN